MGLAHAGRLQEDDKQAARGEFRVGLYPSHQMHLVMVWLGRSRIPGAVHRLVFSVEQIPVDGAAVDAQSLGR